ncbi:type II CRISPR-associated endonuclease Cas1 [Demequina sediminicola]|uniref:type II CRISPR-associated endonuclease Cas1 n=1 Tax=Demequina sediminicola TaxID=1095026 RepID=UPI0009E58615|nr:type II CRISPR-associated endonuclease Cas1 [Demequina sediminicola]
MIGRVVEVVEADRRITVEYGNLIICSSTLRIGQVALDDIQSVVLNPHGATISAGAIAALAERGVPVVVVGRNFAPIATVLPMFGHHEISRRIEIQSAISQPARKQAWRQIVRAKIGMQALALEAYGIDSAPVRNLVARVRSGDPENLEAQAARLYWRRLFGPDFRRDHDLPGVNALLNYGYAIIRSATARSIVAVGLHPSLGVHHRNTGNPMCLVDDLMEPFRPLVDVRVRAIVEEDPDACVEPSTKKMLVAILSTDVSLATGSSPVSLVIHKAAHSLVQYHLGESKRLAFPDRACEETMQALSEAYQ